MLPPTLSSMKVKAKNILTSPTNEGQLVPLEEVDVLDTVDHAHHRIGDRKIDVPVAGVELRHAGALRLDPAGLNHMVRTGRKERETKDADEGGKDLFHGNSLHEVETLGLSTENKSRSLFTSWEIINDRLEITKKCDLRIQALSSQMSLIVAKV